MPSFGMMAPPPPQDEYGGLSPLMQQQYVDQPFDAEVEADAPPLQMMPPPTDVGGGATPNWDEQLRSASSTPPGIEHHIQNELKGVASHMKPSQDGAQNKWLSSLAPILAGAAAIFGGSSGNPAISNILGGVSKGYTSHLMDQAKEAASLKHESDSKTIDLAHKYLAELPGDVDPSKYPRLGELGQKIREQLVNGKLSNPKEAQDFILEFTHYKNDIDKEKEDTKAEQLKTKARAPMDALRDALIESGMDPATAGSALMGKFAGQYEDPEHPGKYVPPQAITGQYGLQRQGAADAASSTRTSSANASREKVGAAHDTAAAARVATREKGANARSKARLGAGGGSGKAFDAAFKAATAHARALDAKRPISDSKQLKLDTYEYMLQEGHVVPIQGPNGQTGYYIGNGQVTTNRAKAESIAQGKGSNVMTSPPPSTQDENYEEEEPEF